MCHFKLTANYFFQLLYNFIKVLFLFRSEFYEEPLSENSSVDLSAAAPTDISADPQPDIQQPEAPVDDQIAEDSKSSEADYDADSDAVEIDNPDFSFKTAAVAASPQHSHSSHKTAATASHSQDSDKTAALTLSKATADLSSKIPAIPAPPRRGGEPEANRKQLAQPQVDIKLKPF